jgi:hypothetical protein
MTSSTTSSKQIAEISKVVNEISAMPSYSRLTPEDRLNIIVDLILDAIEQEEGVNNVNAI